MLEARDCRVQSVRQDVWYGPEELGCRLPAWEGCKFSTCLAGLGTGVQGAALSQDGESLWSVNSDFNPWPLRISVGEGVQS